MNLGPDCPCLINEGEGGPLGQIGSFRQCTLLQRRTRGGGSRLIWIKNLLNVEVNHVDVQRATACVCICKILVESELQSPGLKFSMQACQEF